MSNSPSNRAHHGQRRPPVAIGATSDFGVLPTTGRRNVFLERLVAAVIAIVCLTVLGIAAFLNPSTSGIGTHTQIGGLNECVWLSVADLPCPTCGMTTAFAHATNGNLLASFLTQPMGFVLAIFTAMTFWIASYVAVTGSPMGLFALRLWRPSFIWAVALFTILAWAYKIWIVRGGF